jgi:Zn-dependent protease with chaperone function
MLNVITLVGGAVIMASIYHGRLSSLPLPVVMVAAAFLAAAPAVALCRAQERWLGLPVGTFRDWLRGCGVVWLILLPHLALIAATALFLPRGFGPLTVGLLLLLALLVALCGLGGGLWLAARLGVARPAGERLQGIVTRTGERMGFQPRSAWELAWGRPNAFAITSIQAVGFTDGALEALDDAQLEAICAHELGHLAESRGTRIVRVLALYAFYPVAALKPLVAVWGPAAGLVALALPFVLMLGLGRWSRRLERDADHAAQEHEAEAGTYAQALERIHAAALIPAVLGGKGQSHPELYDRLVAAGVTPAYPRPNRPPQLRSTLTTALVTVLFGLLLLTPRIAAAVAERFQPRSEAAMLATLTLTGDPWELTRLAKLRLSRNDLNGAIQALQTYSRLAREDVFYTAVLAQLLVRQNRFPEAEATLREAEDRAERYGVDDYDERRLDSATRMLERARLRRKQDDPRKLKPVPGARIDGHSS